MSKEDNEYHFRQILELNGWKMPEENLKELIDDMEFDGCSVCKTPYIREQFKHHYVITPQCRCSPKDYKINVG